MTERVLHYYQTITDPAFARHMIEETGLTDDQKKMAWDFRRKTGNTEFFAERAKLPVKRFNAVSAQIHMRMVDELIRLAQIGWKTEKQNKA